MRYSKCFVSIRGGRNLARFFFPQHFFDYVAHELLILDDEDMKLSHIDFGHVSPYGSKSVGLRHHSRSI